ncbi:synaptojanin-1 [Toxorhynchites rutilus septentrionalis]|uniref:synaptojanin-1 n=1 Tax=Toxorhynchites rutilus septentrionalis TaxID=329112 RepID=UPI002479233C|nr:synaptojanin-1 [Toxorhynchites rutilus septentrionalis]XP_055620672.1 synaptojanin-1 [Toxorhynchites rutilus septentrionalis]
MAMSKGFRVLEKSKPPSPHSILLEHRNKSETLLFESQAVAALSAQETEIVRKQYTKVLDAYGCLGVLQLNAGDSSLLYLVMVTGCFSVGKILDSEIFRITQTQFVSLQYQPTSEDRISEIRKVLNSGTFYFSFANATNNAQQAASGGFSFDITLSAQRRRRAVETDNRFFWNRMLFIHMLRFGVECNFWLLKAMCGSVEIRTVYAGSKQARAAIVSRLSCERAGTRFNVRGTNDEGCVANFVETEQCIYLDNEVSSYIQTRGSVPLFWEQPGVQVGSHKVKLSRGFEASKSAFDKHMTTMKARYGKQAIINLLGTSLIGSKEGEAMLSNEFQRHHKESNHTDVPHLVFDYHQECRGGNTSALSKLKAKIDAMCSDFGLFHAISDSVFREQKGAIRTNCLDCLDRTNCVQTYIGLEILNEQISQIAALSDKKQQISSRFEEVFRQMWINNGNEVSKIYAGTGAIQGGSKLMDGARSAARTIQNNLLDNSKQEAIDVLLVGSTLSSELADRARILLPSNMLHAPTPVLRELCRRYEEFVSPMDIRIACGTYNVNGGKHFRSVAYKDVSLSDWLLDCHRLGRSRSLVDVSHQEGAQEPPIDIFAIGFQEIVDLNASNIVAASSDNAKAWAEELQKVISRDEEYVLLTYQQLVGVCLYIYIRPQHAQHIRDVAIDCVKTGLGGATGNKGAAAIRFVINGTSICFVCAHFAAGQSQVAERNADYAEITRKIAFPMGRSLKSHDYIFWCGDFNYRIDMEKDELKELLKQNDIGSVLQYDQLRIQQNTGSVFNDFLEGEISFPPTYKYDLFSDDYDTSEKCRAPAWTDRVLWRRRKQSPDADKHASWNPGRLVHYGRAELKQSDHRPVIAIIDIEIFNIDQQRRSQVFSDVIRDLGPPDGTILIQATNTANNADSGEEDEGSIYDENLMSALIQELTQIGEVTLVRFVGDTMWVTFRDGQSALTAAQKQFVQVCGVNLAIKLKTEQWIQRVEKEILLCTPNTVSFCDSQMADYNSLGIPKVPSRPKSPPSQQQPPSRPAPPGRPPLPKSPQASPKHQPQQQQQHHHHHPKAGVISLGAEVLMASKLQQKSAVPPAPLIPSPAKSKATIEEYASSSPALGSPAHGQPPAGNVMPQDTGAIYEEINDDVAIPEPRGPPPPPPRCDVYDLDVISSNKTNKSSPPGTSSSSGAGSPQCSMPAASGMPSQMTPMVPKTNPPPLPVRRGAPPPIPNRSGGAPPLPARPNNQ